MHLVITALAREELAEAKRYYERQQSGLGLRFQHEAEGCTRRILEFPRAWQIERGNIRRFLFHKFPYKFLYSIEGDHIVVIALAHQSRQPDYWVKRIDAKS